MIYKHFKGGFYLKLFTALDCNESDNRYVVYMALQNKHPFKVGQLWLREESEFNDIHPTGVKRLRKLTLKEHLLFLTGRSYKI